MRQWTQTDGCDAAQRVLLRLRPRLDGASSGRRRPSGRSCSTTTTSTTATSSTPPASSPRTTPRVVDELRAGDDAARRGHRGGADTGITPQWRPFDAYASHSWAAGTSEFADGNNQESSSEAVTAWAGLELWAQAAEDPDLERQAAWLLGSEAHAATTYWTNFDTTDPVYDGFEHGVMGINWGGKRDYATWFSAEPSAILGHPADPDEPVLGLPGR